MKRDKISDWRSLNYSWAGLDMAFNKHYYS